METPSPDSAEHTPAAAKRIKVATFFAVAVLAILLFFAGRSNGTSKTEAGQRIWEIVETKSPDDFTSEDALQLSDYAKRLLDGTLRIDSRAALLLIRAFTFGCEEAMKPDYFVASNLVEKAVVRHLVDRQNPDLLFLRSTIVARTASSPEELNHANELLEQAKSSGSFEAQAKVSQGGFLYFASPQKREFWDELIDTTVGPALVDATVGLALAGEGATFGSGLAGGVVGGLPIISLVVGKRVFDSVWNQLGSTDKTIAFLREMSDAYDTKVSEPLALLVKYDAVRTASVLAEEPQDTETGRKQRIWMLLGRQGGTFLGSPKLESYRRVIVCTKEPCLLFEKKKLWKDGFENVLCLESDSCRPKRRTDDFLAMPAGDIECYNREIAKLFPGDQGKLLRFDTGHPKNGCTYVQHPHRKNEYIELSDFSFRMLKEKAAELDRVLSSLGAKEIKVSVLDSESGKKEDFKQIETRLKGEVGPLKGSVDANLAFAHSEYQRRVNGIQIEAKRTGHSPRYPKGDSFPFFSERNQAEWQTLAQDVCKGERKIAKFRLTYQDDYGYDSSWAGNLGVSVGNGIKNGSIGIAGIIQTSLILNKYLVWECEAMF